MISPMPSAPSRPSLVTPPTGEDSRETDAPEPGSSQRKDLREFGSTQHAPVGSYAVHAAAATEVLLDAIARSDGTRATVSRALLATRLSDSTIGPVRFDRNGDLIAPSITIVRVRDRDGVSQIEAYEGAAFDRVIRPPPRISP